MRLSGVKLFGRHILEKLFTTIQLAEVLDTNPGTLSNWRTTGIGPRFIKVGSHVRYREIDVEEWLDSHSAVKTAEAGVPPRSAA